VIDELDEVVLKLDLPDHGLAAGDIGTVVFVHDEGKGYEVEFMTLDGETIAVATLRTDSSIPTSATTSHVEQHPQEDHLERLRHPRGGEHHEPVAEDGNHGRESMPRRDNSGPGGDDVRPQLTGI